MNAWTRVLAALPHTHVRGSQALEANLWATAARMHEDHTVQASSYLRSCVAASADITSRHRLRSTSSRRYAHASEVWRTFIFASLTKSLEQSAIITA